MKAIREGGRQREGRRRGREEDRNEKLIRINKNKITLIILIIKMGI